MLHAIKWGREPGGGAMVHTHYIAYCLLALWTCVEYGLSLVSWPCLLSGVCHLIITTLRALSFHLWIANITASQRLRIDIITAHAWTVKSVHGVRAHHTRGPCCFSDNLSFSLRTAKYLQEYSSTPSYTVSVHTQIQPRGCSSVPNNAHRQLTFRFLLETA